MSEYPLNLSFSKVLKGKPTTAIPFIVGLYITDIPDCFFTNLQVPGREIIEGMETSLKLQETTSKTERTWIRGPYAWSADEDEDEGKPAWEFQWQKLVVKETLKDGEVTQSRAWISLGEKGEDVVATENWKE